MSVPTFYTVPEAAKLLKICPKTVYAEIRAGRLKEHSKAGMA